MSCVLMDMTLTVGKDFMVWDTWLLPYWPGLHVSPQVGQFVVLPDITDIDLFLVAGVRWCTCWSVCSYLNPITLLYPSPASPQPNMSGYSQNMLHLHVVPFTCSTQRGKGAFLRLLCACCYVLLVEHVGALESRVWYAWRPILEEG